MSLDVCRRIYYKYLPLTSCYYGWGWLSDMLCSSSILPFELYRFFLGRRIIFSLRFVGLCKYCLLLSYWHTRFNVQLSCGVSNNLIFLCLHNSFIACTKSFLPLKASGCFHVAGGWNRLSLLVLSTMLSPWSPLSLLRVRQCPGFLIFSRVPLGKLASFSLVPLCRHSGFTSLCQVPPLHPLSIFIYCNLGRWNWVS